MKPVRIDLEKLARRIGWTGKRADYLLATRNAVVVVEETSRAKIDDVEKLDKTVEAILRGPLKNHLPAHCNPSKIIAVVHAQRVDPMIARIVRSRTGKAAVYRTASCDQHLGRILCEHTGVATAGSPRNR